MKTIYIADDDVNICDLLKTHIEKAGYNAKVFNNGKSLYDFFLSEPCDMIITDIVMPHMTGYELCKEIRKISMIPVFMISAHNDEIDRVLGLELGSDDYISKPISFRELLVKIKNTFNRVDNYGTIPQEKDVIQCMDLTLHKTEREVHINNELLQTSTKEFELLQLFLENQNRPFSREQIIEIVWGYDYFGDTRQVDHIIKRLRKKMLQMDAVLQIQTVWGFGYKIGGMNEEKHNQ
jgi:DNA-binding response OmpR family regulator